VDLQKGEWSYLNTLGIAYYRAGRFPDAVTTLDLSLAKGAGRADALDLYFLAMCHHQLDAPQRAGDCLAKANAWAKRHASLLPPESQDELEPFRGEAETLLGAPSTTAPD
jgi:hypothetical protein